MSFRATLAVFVIAALPALGCGGESGQTGEEGQTEAASAESMATPMRTVQLDPLNNSGIRGSATIGHEANALKVSVQLTGLTAGESYPAHIHQGTCQQQGPVVAPLGEIQADANGSATAEFEVPMDQIMSGGSMMEGEGTEEQGAMEEGEQGMEEGGQAMQEGEAHGMASYYVQVHRPDGTPAACGAIEVESGSHM